MDAFTSKEYTCFYAKVLDEHLRDAIELLADIVQHPLFDADELERERKVVLEEIRMIDDTPDDVIYDMFSSLAFPGNPLGRPIQGTEATVRGLSRRQLLNFFRQSYRPQNMMIVAAGNLQHGRVSRIVGKAFEGLPRGRAANGKVRRPRTGQGVVTRSKRELEQLHLLMGLPAFCRRFGDRYSLFVLNSLLGGTMSSRLFQRIREERGLVYNVYSGVNSFIDTGMLNIYAGTSPDSGREVVRLVADELRQLRDHGPSEEEVSVAKENLKGSMMLSLESTSSRMSNLARQEIFLRRQLTLEETVQGVEQVTTRKVHRLARSLFDGQRLSLAAVGRVGRLRLRPRDLTL